MDYAYYKQAENLQQLLRSILCFLLSLRHSVKFRTSYKSTCNYYCSVYKNLHKIIESYTQGNLLNALRELDIFLVDWEKIQVDENSIKKGTSLFRMRTQENYKLYKKKDLFHIPTDKVNKSGHARYNLNGFPCLYLGTTLYVCWEETRRPGIEAVNYVKMTATRDIPVISVLCPTSFEKEDDVKRFFIFALCTKMVKDDSDKFQFAYAFPEMLLHVLISKMSEMKRPYAIKYLSARYFNNDGQFTSEGLFYNYVLPIGKDIDAHDHLDNDLKRAFKISDPKALYVNRVYGKMPNLGIYRLNEYSNTLFDLLEKDLKVGKRL